MGAAGPRPEDDRRRARNPPPSLARLRTGRAPSRQRRRPGTVEFRRSRRRSHRSGIGGNAVGDRPPRLGRRIQFHRSQADPDHPARRRTREFCPLIPRICPEAPKINSADWESKYTPRRWLQASNPPLCSWEKPVCLLSVILWAAGVAASPLGKKLGAPTDRAGRVLVNPDLSIPGHPEVFVIGDLAALKDESGQLVPGVAPAAIQQGKATARNIVRDLQGKPRKTFTT